MASPATEYTRTAIALHWLIALLIFGMFPLGIYMVDLPLSPQKLKIYSWHKWAGVTVFLLAVTRAAWRVSHPARRRPPRCRPGSAAPPTSSTPCSTS